MIRNIIFDIGNVLVGYNWREYMDSFGFPAEKEQAVAAALFGSDTWTELDRGRIPLPQLEEMFAANAPQYAEDVLRVFHSSHRCIHKCGYAIPWIQALHEQGLRVYYLSNYSQYMIEKTRDALNFLPYMDGGLFSCEVMLVKPEPEIFRALQQRCPEIVPEESVFFDDVAANVEAARALGFQGIVFQNYEQARQALAELTV